MNRRSFLALGAGSAALAAAANGTLVQVAGADAGGSSAKALEIPNPPAGAKLNIKPVMTNILHTAPWQGPCRWSSVSVADEKRNAEASFERWSKSLRDGFLGKSSDVHLLEPVHLTFSEDFVLKPAELAKLEPDRAAVDAIYVYPAGSSVSAYEIGKHLGKPILLVGLGCRNVDIAAYTTAKGNEAFVAKDQEEFTGLISLLRARKVFTQTRVLFPTDRGLPASCSVGSIWDLDDLKKRLGVAVQVISYKEMADEMDRVQGDRTAAAEAEQAAKDLLQKADKSFLDANYVMRSFQFHRAINRLMARHDCNAFTIECFEFCSSRLPQKWMIAPCLTHSLLRNLQCASSCEGDLGSLLGMRMLMSVAGKSCHQGNSDPRGHDAFRINHSVPSMKMNGFDQPDVPFQLGRFVAEGWGTKVVVDFLNNPEKIVTVARVDPLATKVLILKGRLTGASGWGQDLLGCSVEAVIQPPEGRNDEFLKKRLHYGNHLQWVYGDHAERMRQLAEMLHLGSDVIA